MSSFVLLPLDHLAMNHIYPDLLALYTQACDANRPMAVMPFMPVLEYGAFSSRRRFEGGSVGDHRGDGGVEAGQERGVDSNVPQLAPA